MQGRYEVINEFIAVLPIHGGDKRQKIEGQRRIEAQEPAELHEFFRWHGEIQLVAARLSLNFRDSLQIGEFGLDGREQFVGGHATGSAFLWAAASMLYFSIFFWSAITPCCSASGRGGHPGTYTSTGITLSTPLHTE